jgi:hypothetical protein
LKINLIQSIIENKYSILSGYTGNGKTTFLYWFKEQTEQYYDVDIINVIYEGTGFDLDMTLVEKCLTSKLWERFDVYLFEIICKNRYIFSKYFSPDLLDMIQNYFQRYDNETRNFDYFNSIVENINNRQDAKNTSFSQKMILYVLNVVLQQIRGKTHDELNDIKPYLLCFDNLDGLKIEYLTTDIWEGVLDATSKLDAIFENLEETRTFNYIDKIRLLLVLREVNLAVGAAQANDRLAHRTRQIRFLYTNNAREIAEKRLKEYNKYEHNNELTPYNYDDAVFDLTHIILEDKKLMNERLLPLFNYDYRQFFEAVIQIVIPRSISGKTYSLFNMTQEQYNAFPKENRMTNGRRGIFMNTFIRYLSRANFLERIAPRTDIIDSEPHCNYARMFLTVLSNLSFDNRVSKQRDEGAEAEPTAISLTKIYHHCKKIMPVENFLATIKSLIDFNKSSWAHLITIYNKKPTRIGSECIFDFSLEQEYLKDKTHTDELSKISISLNASAYIYLRYILTHFEYIAAYKAYNNKDSIYDYKPLFLRTNISFKDLKWEFEETIENVYKIVEAYKDRTEKFFKKKMKFTYEEYCAPSSIYIFKRDYDNKIRNKSFYPLYMTRLLTTHIRYLDDFRIYLNDYCGEKIEKTLNKITDRTLAGNFKDKEGINAFILNYIEKYIALLDGVEDPSKGDITEKFKEQLVAARVNAELPVQIEDIYDSDDELEEVKFFLIRDSNG